MRNSRWAIKAHLLLSLFLVASILPAPVATAQQPQLVNLLIRLSAASSDPAQPADSQASLKVNDSVNLQAVPLYADQVKRPAIPVTWTPDSSKNATVDPSTGLVTAVKTGKAVITAMDPVTKTQASFVINVVPGDLQSISITAPVSTIAVGSTVQLLALGTFNSTGKIAHTEPVTTGLTWFPAPSTFVSVAPTGLATGIAAGAPTVATATYAADPKVAVTGFSLTVTAPVPTTALPTPVVLIGQLNAGSQKVTVQGNANDTIYLYQFDAGYIPQNRLNSCGVVDLSNATPLAVTTGGVTQNSFSLTSTAPQTVSLYSSLLIGTQLCVGRTPASVAGSAAPATDYSAFYTIADPNAYGRLRTYFTAGSVITNQQTTASTSTAGVYLDLDLDYSFIRAGEITSQIPKTCRKGDTSDQCMPKYHYHRGPGFDTFFAARLSPIPVATMVSSTPAAGSSVPATTSLNVLTSQQSAHVVMGAFLPVVTTRYYNKSNVFTVGPTARFGFDTLLNPSVGTTAGTPSTPAAAVLQTASFSSVYNFYSGGVRISWDQLPRSTDQAPQTWTEINLSVGKFSNLPTYVCTTSGGLDVVAGDYPTTPAPILPLPASSCGTGTYAAQHYASRASLPRLSLIGKAQFPNYPFVLGIDANLAQYSVGRHKEQVDYLNKPGNDIRIYFGVTFNLLSAISKLNITGL
jgi:hypothetical protein